MNKQTLNKLTPESRKRIIQIEKRLNKLDNEIKLCDELLGEKDE